MCWRRTQNPFPSVERVSTNSHSSDTFLWLLYCPLFSITELYKQLEVGGFHIKTVEQKKRSQGREDIVLQFHWKSICCLCVWFWVDSKPPDFCEFVHTRRRGRPRMLTIPTEDLCQGEVRQKYMFRVRVMEEKSAHKKTKRRRRKSRVPFASHSAHWLLFWELRRISTTAGS
jgi:hypothetical protein